MTEQPAAAGSNLHTSAGHLSVHFEGQHPPEIQFLFEQQSKRLLPSFIASFVLDVSVVLLLVLLNEWSVSVKSSQAVLPDEPNEHIVWLSQPGPGGGGGGGGNK